MKYFEGSCIHAKQHRKKKCVKSILIIIYFVFSETGEAEVETRIITVKMAMANQRRKIDKKKVLAGKQVFLYELLPALLWCPIVTWGVGGIYKTRTMKRIYFDDIYSKKNLLKAMRKNAE